MLHYLDWIGLVFTIVTLPLNTLLIYVLYQDVKKAKKNTSSFFEICFVTAVVDELSLLVMYTLYQPPKWGIYLSFYEAHDQLIMYTSFYTSWALGPYQCLLTTMLAVNRYTVLLDEARYRKIFNDGRVWHWMGGLFCCTSSFACLVFISPAVYELNDLGGKTQKLTRNIMLGGMFLFTGTIMFCCCIAICIMYYKIFKELHSATLFRSEQRGIQRKREVNLLAMSAIVCFILLLSTCYIVSKSLFGFDHGATMYNLVNTLCSGVNPYLLLSFSDKIRQHFIKILQCKVVHKSCQCFKWKIETRPATPTINRSAGFSHS